MPRMFQDCLGGNPTCSWFDFAQRLLRMSGWFEAYSFPLIVTVNTGP
jgi:hypothetical protein